jgi:hypothetical protein
LSRRNRRQPERDWWTPDSSQQRLSWQAGEAEYTPPAEDASEEVWLPSVGAALPGSFRLATDEELAELAATSVHADVAEGAASGRARTEGSSTMSALAEERPATARKKSAKKSAIAGLSKTKLRAYLLSHVTVPDKAWNAAYGAPEREKGESREAYIKRVLA